MSGSRTPPHPRVWVAVAGPLGLAIALGPLALSGCVQPQCSSPDYGEAECRVLAENVHARLRSSQGVELRFQDPDARDDRSWEARGLLSEGEDGTVRARVAGPGRFALSLRAPDEGDVTVALQLTNVDPAATLSIGPDDAPVDLPADPAAGSRRNLTLDLAAGQTQWIRGDRPCPSRYRLAFAGDIQTNPTQFERIADRLQREADDASAAGEPLVGLVLVGDLSEASRDDEFDTILQILARLPFPVAVTAGNHDIYRPTRPYFNRSFGPGNHAFDVCGAHVALLDSGSGAIARSVQARLPELLHRGDARFLVAGMHHPPFAGQTGSGWSREEMAAALLVELAREQADLVVAGHAHALRDFPEIPVGDTTLREVVVGTAGAYQGAGIPRYGYLRVVFDDEAQASAPCFVEVPPAGFATPPNDPPSDRLPYCADP